MAEAGSYFCPLCSYPTTTLKLYVSHLRVIHSKDPSFAVICGVGGCREVFRTFSAFNSHIYRRHRSDMGIPGSELQLPRTSILSFSPRESLANETRLNPTDSTSSLNMMEGMDYEEQANQNENCSLHTTSVPNLNHFQPPGRSASEVSSTTVIAAKMLLQLREGHHVSQVALTEVISGCRLLCTQTLNKFKGDIATILQVNDLKQENLALTLSKTYDPFESIDTNYLFEKFCTDHLGYLVSLYACSDCVCKHVYV